MEPSAAALVLNGLVIRGLCSGKHLVASTQLDQFVVGAELAKLIEAGDASQRLGVLPGYLPTSKGIQRRRELSRTELGVTEPERATATFARFGLVNSQFKQLCADVQLAAPRAGVPPDAESRLVAIHGRACDFIGLMSEFAPRWSIYQSRLEDALRRVLSDHWDLLTKPMAESYHDVWMELHQDMLETLELQRAEGDF